MKITLLLAALLLSANAFGDTGIAAIDGFTPDMTEVKLCGVDYDLRVMAKLYQSGMTTNEIANSLKANADKVQQCRSIAMEGVYAQEKAYKEKLFAEIKILQAVRQVIQETK